MKSRIAKNSGYEIDTACIAAHYQPAILIELALSRDIDSRQLLRSTRMRLEDFESADTLISPDQYLTLIANSNKLLDANDTSFLYGQRLLPGFFGAASQALQQVTNCRQAIEILCEFHAILSPLQTPRTYEDDEFYFIYWEASCSNKEQRFTIESSMTAVISMVSWLSKEKIPWQCEFNYDKPDYIEQYWVNLGQDLVFNQQMNRMRLPKSWLDKTWPNAAPLSINGTLIDSQKQLKQRPSNKSFLDNIYDYIHSNINQPLNLDKLSLEFGLSPASMKRKLKKHNTSFQQQIDLVRKNTAIYLYQIEHLNNQKIAEYLCFNDMNNFRRAFKRWTGTSPYILFAQ
ncbi:MAG: AraC family transcriptional regulator [Gammaproteobacteria bacterium]|nr:MAG: AraC family transcriptional regulator [Gammaproteobacteria bacterium]